MAHHTVNGARRRLDGGADGGSMAAMQRSATAWWAGLLLATAVGGAVRFVGLGFRDFWFDESCSYIYVRDLFDWQGGHSLLVESTNLPYYLALRGWTSVFGSSEAAYRALSALAATLTVPLLGLIGRRLGGGRAGIAVAFLAALHPLHIHYAHEARAYALWLLLLALSLHALLAAVQREDRRWWAAYAVALLASLLTHYYTLFWAPASAVVVALARDRIGAFRRWAVATGAALLVFCPYLVLAVLPAAKGGGSAWVASSWSPGTAVFETLWAFLPAGAYPAHLRGLSLDSPDTVPVAPQWIARTSEVLPAAIVIGCGLAAWAQWRRAGAAVQIAGSFSRIGCSDQAEHELIRAPSGREERTRVSDQGLEAPGYHRAPCRATASASLPPTWTCLLVVGALVALPLALAWTYSLLIRPVYLPGRYDLVAWPAFVVLIGLLLAQVSSAGTGAAVASSLEAGGTAPSRSRLCSSRRGRPDVLHGDTESAAGARQGSPEPIEDAPDRSTMEVKVAAMPGPAEPIGETSARRDHAHRALSWGSPGVRLALLLSPLLLCAAVPVARQFALRPSLTIHHSRAIRLAELCGSGDKVIALSYDRAAMLYYLDRAGFRGEIASFPSWLDDQIGWLDTEADLKPDRVAAMREEATALCADIGMRLDRGRRVLLLQDSMAILVGSNPREAITEILLNALHESALELSLIDERHVLAEVRQAR